MRATASMSRSTTYISLKMGSWMVTRGSRSNFECGAGRLPLYL